MATEYPALPAAFLDAMDRFPSSRTQSYRTPAGWQTISSEELVRRIAGVAKALTELGVVSGDRVAVFAPNCPEWHVADFAIQGIGGVTVPVYFHESAERISYILKDSGARVVFTSGEEQARKVAQCRANLPELQHVISVAPPADLQGESLRYDALIAAAGDAEIAEYRRRAAEVASDKLATIIYTSGTTGEPKGVMLSHSNLSSNLIDGTAGYEMSPSDVGLSFLPLAHVYERTNDYAFFLRGVPIAYVEQMETVQQALLEVHPTFLGAVPRFYEKIYANVIEQGHRETGIKRRVFDWAIRVAGRAVPWRAYGKSASPFVKFQWELADKIVYAKIRAGVGGRIRVFTAGGAPLAPELAEFFWSVGLPVFQGYGLTETSPIVTANSPRSNKIGTVGPPIPNVQVRIAEDGEILVKGPCVMQGYYHKPDATREVLSADGWFSTGDIGRLDDEGNLIITDRKKELLKTAGGKFVAPAPIENSLKTSPYIANAMVVGDKRKFVSVLIVPNFATIASAARDAGRDAATPGQMLTDPWVRDLISHEIERLTPSLAQYEKPKRFALLEKDFTYGDGALTYTLKLKRRVIEDRYRDVIERMYADVEEPKPQRAR
ncbi:MAG TPA: long-chain fatty acid--CoA ligase [Candidatus Acidoferrales bacterium]|jgi:long-chain acyl-CoA synthetase|nr:long-chain fatty acid--CoA ligase [Candidatus Acidoferrales bacterium]